MERLLDCDGDHGAGRGGAREANPAMAPIQFCHELWPPPAKKQNCFSLHFSNFCDYLVKKVVYEIRKSHQLITTLRLSLQSLSSKTTIDSSPDIPSIVYH